MTKFFLGLILFPLGVIAADITNSVQPEDGVEIPVKLDVRNPIAANIESGGLGFTLNTRNPDYVDDTSDYYILRWYTTTDIPVVKVNGYNLNAEVASTHDTLSCRWMSVNHIQSASTGITAKNLYRSGIFYQSNIPFLNLKFDGIKPGQIQLGFHAPSATGFEPNNTRLDCQQTVTLHAGSVTEEKTINAYFIFRPTSGGTLRLDKTIHNLVAGSDGSYGDVIRLTTDSLPGDLFFTSSSPLTLAGNYGTSWSLNVPGTGVAREITYPLQFSGTMQSPGTKTITINISRTYK
ncbi:MULTISPECIES: hypothetical protein [unclassified Escherichia]|uniref:hypothetical protein n=1 Tax=unclassified Escherichia TaxID=2608889 RepID=UPI001037E62F|nr:MULTISPECIES: hypothetical protein [unclassified Escherichia]TLI63968.1 hypothetical protein FEK50_22040 [Escherichia sp. E2586]